MKDIKCKCSHLKSEHNKTFFNGHTFCNACQCEDYLKFNKPDKWDLLGLIYGFFMIGLVSLMVIITADIIHSIPAEELEKSAEITMGAYLGTLFIVIIMIFLLVVYMMFDIHIGDYFYRKRRRTV